MTHDIKHKVTFLPDNRSVSIPAGATILEAARQAGVVIEAPCNGAGHCGKCAVHVPSGDLGKLVIHAGHHLSTEQDEAGIVLACHAEIQGDLTVHVPRRSETGLKIVTGGVSHDIERAPFIKKSYHAGNDETIVLAGDSPLAREAGDTTSRLYGVVIDIGTTTLAVGLVDLETGREIVSRSALNPQTVHGQDVLSRIRFAATGAGLETLQKDLIRELDSLIGDAAGEAGVQPHELYEVIFSGNSCMLHLATGTDPAPLGRLPFSLVLDGGNHLPAASLGLSSIPVGLVWLPPLISAYVGADISAGIMAAELRGLSGTTLFIDIGTNGEMVLARNGRLSATATAAGPAFEGMNISCGMRAAAGAIESVSLAPSGDLHFGVIGGGEPAGICGSGLMDLVAVLVGSGVIGKNGRFAVKEAESLPEPLRKRLETLQGKTVVRLTDRLVFTQNDIRQVQLAKGAIRAGIDLLLQAHELSPAHLDRVYIAGSFGYHLREESLLSLGLLPSDARGRISFLGNTAKSGGEMLLINRNLRAELTEIVAGIELVELARNPGFDRTFMEAMAF